MTLASKVLRMLKAPAPPKGPSLAALKRAWRSRASLAYEIPFVDHSARFRFCREEQLAELEAVFALRTDTEVEEYLENFASRYAASLGVSSAVGTSSGTTALTFALIALGVRPGDEVLVPAYTYVATALAVVNAGGVPVFVDSAAQGPHVDAEALASKITPRTKGFIAAHLFGGMSDPAPLLSFRKSNRLFFVEDACQAHGASWDGKPAGSFGDAAAFSFNQNKLVSGLGNGGLLASSNRDLARKARELRDPESPAAPLSRRTPGYLDPVQAACVKAQLGALPALLAHHRALAALYREKLSSLPVDLPLVEGTQSGYWFVIGADERDALADFLKGKGVETRAGFYEPLSRLPSLSKFANGEAFPRARRLWERSLALPIGAHLDLPEIERVAQAVATFYEKRP
jgi:dTDP-4-amino-4,6-dideoxygalactose transaminase